MKKRTKADEKLMALLDPPKGDEKATFLLRVAYRPTPESDSRTLTQNDVWRLVGTHVARLAPQGIFLESVTPEEKRR